MRKLWPVLLIALLAALPAWGLRIMTGDAVVVSEPVNDDLLAAGNRVTISAPVQGDLLLFAQQGRLESTVQGSAIMVAQTLTVIGEIKGSGYAAGDQVSWEGKVGRNLSLAGNTVQLTPGARVARDLFLAGARATISGAISGQLQAAAGDLDLQGQVGQSATVRGDRLALGPSARVGGDLVYTSSVPAEIAGSAVIGGRVRYQERKDGGGATARWVFHLFRIVAALGFLLVTLLAAFLLPLPLGHAAEEIQRQPWLALGVGALVLIVTPIAALLAAITIVGLPLALLIMVIWGLWLYIANVVVAAFVGAAIFRAARTRSVHLAAAAIIGALVLIALGWVPVLGTLVRLAVVLFGLGAVAMTAWWLTHGRPAARMVPPAAPTMLVTAPPPPEPPAAT